MVTVVLNVLEMKTLAILCIIHEPAPSFHHLNTLLRYKTECVERWLWTERERRAE